LGFQQPDGAGQRGLGDVAAGGGAERASAQPNPPETLEIATLSALRIPRVVTGPALQC
jgi:hypothetical protein